MSYVMRQNVLDEIQKPLDKPGQRQVIKTHQIVRDARNYELYTYPEYKRYQLVFNKRVINPTTFETYPYGYHSPTRFLNTNIEHSNIEMQSGAVEARIGFITQRSGDRNPVLLFLYFFSI